jgi:hypothetical protein
LRPYIQIWQFIVLTAGYAVGIEYYLDSKYAEDDKPGSGPVMPKAGRCKLTPG